MVGAACIYIHTSLTKIRNSLAPSEAIRSISDFAHGRDRFHIVQIVNKVRRGDMTGADLPNDKRDDKSTHPHASTIPPTHLFPNIKFCLFI